MVKKISDEISDIPKIPYPTSSVTVETLNKIISSSGLDEQSVYKLYIDSYKTLELKGVKANIEHLALNGVRNAIRRLTTPRKEPKVKAEGFVGFVVGDSGIWDKIAIMRERAKRYVDKYGLKAAITEKLIDENNKILDQRRQIFGKNNANFQKPLKDDEHDVQRTLYLIAKINGDEDYKFGTLQTNDYKYAVAWSKVKFFVPCKSNGIIKEKIEPTNGVSGSFKMNSSSASNTKSTFEALKEDLDVDKIFMDVVTSQLTRIADVEKHHEAFKHVWDRVIIIKGMVAWINRNRLRFGNVSMALMDSETGDMVTVRVPEYVLNAVEPFGEQSEVVVIGKTNRQDLREEDENGKVRYVKGAGEVIIDAVGVYGIKGFVTPPDLNVDEVSSEESEIEGWID